MWRRKFIAGLAGTVAFSLAARAQTPNRIYRLGHLANSADSEAFTRPARVIAVGLVDLRLQHRLHLPRLDTDHW